MATDAGVDVVLHPSADEMYPEPVLTEVAVREISAPMEGRTRPTHFTGVATVVAKLFNIAGPCTAYFGEKDWQQLAVVRRMARDLSFPVTVVGCPTVREPDGLAMSSRNAYLTPEERDAAPVLHWALVSGAAADRRGRARRHQGQGPDRRPRRRRAPGRARLRRGGRRRHLAGGRPARGESPAAGCSPLRTCQTYRQPGGDHRVGAHRSRSNRLDASSDDEVQDSPRHGHGREPQLRRLHHGGPRPDGGSRPARVRAGGDRRHRQRQPLRDLRHRGRGAAARSASTAPPPASSTRATRSSSSATPTSTRRAPGRLPAPRSCTWTTANREVDEELAKVLAGERVYHEVAGR